MGTRGIRWRKRTKRDDWDGRHLGGDVEAWPSANFLEYRRWFQQALLEMEGTKPEVANFGNLARTQVVRQRHQPTYNIFNPVFPVCELCWCNASELMSMVNQWLVCQGPFLALERDSEKRDVSEQWKQRTKILEVELCLKQYAW